MNSRTGFCTLTPLQAGAAAFKGSALPADPFDYPSRYLLKVSFKATFESYSFVNYLLKLPFLATVVSYFLSYMLDFLFKSYFIVTFADYRFKIHFGGTLLFLTTCSQRHAGAHVYLSFTQLKTKEKGDTSLVEKRCANRYTHLLSST